jgi:hypothetical protein
VQSRTTITSAGVLVAIVGLAQLAGTTVPLAEERATYPARLQAQGKQLDGKKTQAIGVLSSPTSDGGCTATMLSARVVLTAKHCLTGRSPASLEFRLGSMAGVRGWEEVKYEVAEAASEPSVTSGGFIKLGADVALLHLKSSTTPIPTKVVFVQPRQLSSNKLFAFGKEERKWDDWRAEAPAQSYRSMKNGAVFAVVGYGEDKKLSGGLRQGALMSATRIGFLLDEKKETDVDQFQEMWLKYGTGSVCHGDSGGPLFTAEYDAVTKGAIPVVYGVLSGGDVNGVTTAIPGQPATPKSCGDPSMPVVYSLLSAPVRAFMDRTVASWGEPALRWKGQ